MASNTDNQTMSGDDIPGKRTFNPLGDFSSYTYQLSLYMITPDAYDAFIQSGRTNINAISNTANRAATTALNNSGAGVYLVAQSGGINDTTSLRAPGFDLDFYIDDLHIKTHTSAKSSGTSSNSSEINFKIIEPYGFSFITKLTTASQMVQQYSKTIKIQEQQNPSKQFFILGIRFQGYDAQGNVVAGTSASPAGEIQGNNGSYERFYDILIKSIKFKLDGRATTYSIEAVSLAPQIALSVKRGRISTQLTAVASTVYEALMGNSNNAKGIFTQLNQQEQDQLKAKKIEIANTYEAVFIGPDGDLLKEASILSQTDGKDKTKFPMSKATDSAEVNAAVAENAVPDKQAKQIAFAADTPIPQAVQLIISQSDFVENALKILYTTEVEGNQDTEQPNTIKGGDKTLKWYNMSTEVSNLGFDSKRKDFSYAIKYVFRTYDTPSVIAFAGGNQSKYPGPYKRYNYYFTGDNREVTGYTQTLNNTYFNTSIDPVSSKDKNTIGGPNDTPLATYKRQSVARQGQAGLGAEASNSYVTYLMDPSAQATAHISILGDPDFLIQENSSSINSLYRKAYGSDGFTVNPNGGQVFIELQFNEATDYNNQTGIMDINKRIQFGFKYPPELNIKGLCWMVKTVDSTFKSGKFSQVLDCCNPTFAELATSENQQQRESSTQSATSASSQARQGDLTTTGTGTESTTQPVGLKTDPSVTAAETTDIMVAEDPWMDYSPPVLNDQITSPTGGATDTQVADDDSVITPTSSQAISIQATPTDEMRETTVISDTRTDSTNMLA